MHCRAQRRAAKPNSHPQTGFLISGLPSPAAYVEKNSDIIQAPVFFTNKVQYIATFGGKGDQGNGTKENDGMPSDPQFSPHQIIPTPALHRHKISHKATPVTCGLARPISSPALEVQ